MNNQIFNNNTSLSLTYIAIDILIGIIFLAIVFKGIYKAVIFTLKTISLIINILFKDIVPKKEDNYLYKHNSNEDVRTLRKPCFVETDNSKNVKSKPQTNTTFQIEANNNQTFEQIINNKNKSKY